MDRESLLAGVQRVLLADWDPCGVGDNPALTDEYDTYGKRITDVLLASLSKASVEAALDDAEAELGITLPRQQRDRAVRALLALLE